MPFEGKYATFY